LNVGAAFCRVAPKLKDKSSAKILREISDKRQFAETYKGLLSNRELIAEEGGSPPPVNSSSE